jgi:hypothetical protein
MKSTVSKRNPREGEIQNDSQEVETKWRDPEITHEGNRAIL